MNRKLRREVRRRRMHSWAPADHNRYVAHGKSLRRGEYALSHLARMFSGLIAAFAVAAAAELEATQAKVSAAFASYDLLPRSRSLGFDPTDHDDEDTE